MIHSLVKEHNPSSHRWGNLVLPGIMYMCQISSPIYSLATVLPVAFNPCAAPWLGSLWLDFEPDENNKIITNTCNWPKNSVCWDAIQLILWILQSYFAVYIMCACVLSSCHFLLVLIISVARILKQPLEDIPENGTKICIMDRYRGLYVLEKCWNHAYQDG